MLTNSFQLPAGPEFKIELNASITKGQKIEQKSAMKNVERNVVLYSLGSVYCSWDLKSEAELKGSLKITIVTIFLCKWQRSMGKITKFLWF